MNHEFACNIFPKSHDNQSVSAAQRLKVAKIRKGFAFLCAAESLKRRSLLRLRTLASAGEDIGRASQSSTLQSRRLV